LRIKTDGITTCIALLMIHLGFGKDYWRSFALVREAPYPFTRRSQTRHVHAVAFSVSREGANGTLFTATPSPFLESNQGFNL